MSIGMVFPGQGSQSVGMLADLAQAYPVVKATFAQASQVLGYDLWALCQEGPEDQLNQTQRTQPALLAAGVAVWRVWQERGGAQPIAMAGHSLGEYSALVCAESIGFAEAVALVARRGELMQEAVPVGVGAMAAILNLDDEAVAGVCVDAAQGDVVQAVNFNAPGQIVIAGHKAAVDRAIVLATERGARRALLLSVSVPSHCRLMEAPARKLADELEKIEVKRPRISVLHNVDGQIRQDPAAIRDALVKQLHNPVRWVETYQGLVRQGAKAIIEAGPGKVLAGLGKRIEKETSIVPVFDTASLDQGLSLV